MSISEQLAEEVENRINFAIDAAKTEIIEIVRANIESAITESIETIVDGIELDLSDKLG